MHRVQSFTGGGFDIGWLWGLGWRRNRLEAVNGISFEFLVDAAFDVGQLRHKGLAARRAYRTLAPADGEKSRLA